MQFVREFVTRVPGVPIIVVLALSGAGLVVSLPALFEPHDRRHELTTLLLAAIFVASWALALLKKHRSGRPSGG
ncbi:hypothetical protein ACH436_08465 [Isoptericola sp. NPDC019693]|uniref:hypothetical protein n=1 Tax=Isoptericola sp. NPDC019693 TaxID=3364009 RepID=UPI0037AC63B2